MGGMDRIWFLHHVNVYALGEFENQQVLVYGRFIISPEPALNSNSTDGFGYEHPQHGGSSKAPLRVQSVTRDEEEIEEFIVREILVSSGQSVNINTTLALLAPSNDPNTPNLINLVPRSDGRIDTILLNEGDLCEPGDTFAIVDRPVVTTSGAVANPQTLKKMVRITRIPRQVWQDIDLQDVQQRHTIAQYVNGLSDSFLLNFAARGALEEAVENLSAESVGNQLTYDELLRRFPARVENVTRNRAENYFLARMLQNFTVPGGNWSSKERSLDSTYLQLDHARTSPNPEFVNALADLGLLRLLNSKPRMNSRFFNPAMRQAEFLRLLRPSFNVPTEEFVKSLSQLEDASRLIHIQEADLDGVSPNFPDESQDFFQIILPDAGEIVTVEKISKPYHFVDPETNFSIEMHDLMSFLRKYYDDSGSQAPREEVRTYEHVDWPLPKPPSNPPPPRDGGTWVWNPGLPGEPPGLPDWSYDGGRKEEVPAPSGGGRWYEPEDPDPDGGRQSYEIAGIAPRTTSDSDSTSGIQVQPESNIFSESHPPIEIDRDGTWVVTPGTPGTDPTQGNWDWEETPPPGDTTADATDRECTTCCFPAGTKILMADGSKKPIEQVVVGDSVKSYDEKTGRILKKEVKEIKAPIRDHVTTLTFSDGSILKLSDEHPVFTSNGWASIDPKITKDNYGMLVERLRVGDKVMDSNKEWQTITTILTRLQETQMYNLSKVDQTETFFANGFLVHNKPVCDCEVCNPGGAPGAGGGADTSDGTAATDASGSSSDGLAGSPGSGGGSSSGSDGSGSGPGAGGSSSSTSGGDPSAGGMASSSDGSSPGSSGTPGSSSGSPSSPGSSSPGGSFGGSGGGGSSPGGSSPGSSGSSTPSSPPRSFRSISGGV